MDRVRLVSRRFMDQYWKWSGDEKGASCLVQQTFEQMAWVAGDATAQRIYEWGRSRFSDTGSTDGKASIWRILLRHLANLGGMGTALVPLALPEYKVHAIVLAVQDHLGESGLLLEQIEALGECPWTGFEERIYRTYDPVCSPLDAMWDVIESYKFDLAWRKIDRLLDDRQRGVLLEWGREQAQGMGIPAELVTLPDQGHAGDCA